MENGIYLLKGNILKEYVCNDKKKILIFDNFKDAEKAYRELNQKTIDSNHADRVKINEAKKVIKNANGAMTPESLEAYMELGDYGMI